MAEEKSPGEWTEFRVRVSRSGQDELIMGMAPLLREIGARGGQALFVREADEVGPCVRFRFLDAGDVITAIPQRAAEFGGTAELAPASAKLGGPAEAFDGPAAEPLVTDFLAGSVDLLLDGVDAAAGSDATRLSLALDLVLAQLPVANFSAVFPERYPGFGQLGYPLTFLSLRSHADGFFIRCADPATARAAMERRYQSVAQQVQRRLRLVLDSLTGDSGPDAAPEAARRWYLQAGPYLQRVDAELRHGRLWFSGGDSRDPAQGGYLGDEHDISVSRFHETVQSSGPFQQFMRTDPGFGAMRVLMSLLYLSLHCLGLKIIDRYFLCHAVSRACETSFDVDATMLLATFTGAVHPDNHP